MRSTAPTSVFAAAAAALLLAGCSGGGEAGPTSAAPSSSSAATASASIAPSPSGSAAPTEIFVSLCDAGTEGQVKAIEAVMKPDFAVTQLADIRTDDFGTHVIVAFVEGPGLAVLATWRGTGEEFTDIAAVDDFAAEASTAPREEATGEEAQLVAEASKCYQTLYLQDDSSDKKDKKDKKDD